MSPWGPFSCKLPQWLFILFTYWDTGDQTQSFTWQTSTLSLSYTSSLHTHLETHFQKSSRLMSLPSTLSWFAISVQEKVVLLFPHSNSHTHYWSSLWLLQSLTYISSQEIMALIAPGNCFCRLGTPSGGNAAADRSLPHLPKVWQCVTALLRPCTVDVLSLASLGYSLS